MPSIGRSFDFLLVWPPPAGLPAAIPTRRDPTSCHSKIDYRSPTRDVKPDSISLPQRLQGCSLATFPVDWNSWPIAVAVLFAQHDVVGSTGAQGISRAALLSALPGSAGPGGGVISAYRWPRRSRRVALWRMRHQFSHCAWHTSLCPD
jgi:hypothetical protein